MPVATSRGWVWRRVKTVSPGPPYSFTMLHLPGRWTLRPPTYPGAMTIHDIPWLQDYIGMISAPKRNTPGLTRQPFGNQPEAMNHQHRKWEKMYAPSLMLRPVRRPPKGGRRDGEPEGVGNLSAPKQTHPSTPVSMSRVASLCLAIGWRNVPKMLVNTIINTSEVISCRTPLFDWMGSLW